MPTQGLFVRPDVQNGECFLRQLDVTDLLHTVSSTFFLLLQQLFLHQDIAAITFSHMFLRSCFTVDRENARTNRCLNGDIKLLAWDQIFHLLHQRDRGFANYHGGDQRQRINTFTVD